MGYFEECIKSAYKDIRRGGVFGKKVNVSLIIYSSRISGQAFNAYDQGLMYTEFNIPYDNIKSVSLGTVEGDKCISIDYKNDKVLFSSNNTAQLVIIGLDDLEGLAALIQETRNKRLDQIKSDHEKEMIEIKRREEEAVQREKDASDFYKSCYDFHIKPDTPVHIFSSNKNTIVAMYVDADKGLNFLDINGYKKEEIAGHIPFNKLHYYEKAGNVSYTTDIHGSYSSFGGSMTGARYSKLAAALGGALFGFMGMTAGALFSYKPAKQEPISTSFSINSDVIKIDDRNVILNFYSDEKKQYIDIELPQDVYNFLQTYLPEKKYQIVEELERKAAVHQSKASIESGAVLHASSRPAIAPPAEEKPVDTMTEFKMKVEKLKMMKEAGLLSDDEFDEERKKLLTMI